MKRTLEVLAALTVGTVSIANAEVQANVADAPQNPLVTPWSRPQPTYRFIDPGLPSLEGDGVSAAVSNVIYLNNCQPSGCQVMPGTDNAMANRSSVPDEASLVQPFRHSDAMWRDVVECVKQTYAPFAVQIVTDRPTSGNYHMAIVAGSPGNVGMGQGVGGVSPFSCDYIPNAISYSFANIYGSVDDICWTVAQETAHSWGLDHKFDNKDPMTYLQSGPSRKTFQNASGPCGEFQARSCSCGGSQMNSFQMILSTFGSSVPTPPMVTFTAPRNGDVVDPGFPIRADIRDDVGLSKVEMRINNQLLSTLTAPPYVWNAPATLGQGNHLIKITAYDVGGTPADQTITVTIGSPCKVAADCSESGDVCLGGRCVAGPTVTGGLGKVCTGNTDCASGQCGTDTGGNSYCVEGCDVANDACPTNFACVAAGNGGICWPAEEDTGCSAGGARGGSLLGLALGALLIGRRRRR